MEKEPLQSEEPVPKIGFTVGQVRQDYRCEIGVRLSALDDVDAHREELRQMESSVHTLQQDTRTRSRRVLESLQKAYDRVFHIIDFKQHLAAMFKRNEVEDTTLIEQIDRTHPCRKELKNITAKLRTLAKRRDEDVRRMRLLLHMASRLAGADHKIQKDEKKVLKGMLSDRRWKKRLQKEARRRAEMDEKDEGVL